MLNSGALNSAALNSRRGFSVGFVDWSLLAPVERQSIYVLDIEGVRLPVSSAQATMRLEGQSFMQVVVPAGSEYIDSLEGLLQAQMKLKSGFRYADGTESPLEDIAEAPFEILRRDEGPYRDTLTLSGYGPRSVSAPTTRQLVNVQTRSSGTSGSRRVRCDIDLFLRPGHTAIDGDGAEFSVGIIQYFIGAQTEAMEVLQDG
ncbi:hypothetical protein [Billgrantia bachuensis]|uniref:Uncharacterized protein n=1 Tax=Billgrantia bachuensis TaxID=2717286 RepID=A0ABX0PT41_9GAMM|nr:hypothetical protein [Halomonas bachuensis]NIC05273.1 hypothetical protein [Halomonas bachuensis]